MRTHFINIFSRDTGQCQTVQGVTTKVYPLRYSEEEPTQECLTLALSREGLCDFPASLRYGFVGVVQDYTFLAMPCASEKSLQTRLEYIFDMGSSYLPHFTWAGRGTLFLNSEMVTKLSHSFKIRLPAGSTDQNPFSVRSFCEGGSPALLIYLV